MRRVGRNSFSEIYFWGCNPSFIATDDGVVLIDTPQQPKDALKWKEAALEHGPIRYLINTEPHPDHILGNAYFPGVEVIGQQQLQPRYEAALPMMTGQERVETMKQADPDSVWLLNHPDYPPNPPTRLFDKEMTLNVGKHTFQIVHMPGHTGPQTSVIVPEEGVVFTGDNVFYKCKTFIQEADPWEWLAALDQLAALDVETIVPGHGEVCTKVYLNEQGEIIRNWLELVEQFVKKGMTEEEALKQPLDVPKLDPYPIGQRLFPMSDRLNGMNVSNIYKHVAARQNAR
ncbi:MAG TPA: MBL fold metallo-hydrolase [Chloroflexota bacterium]|nr:MBL fold metallo-hydrolase [Chloroflexota bacterium]